MHDTWLAKLLEKHSRQGVLVDANLLFVYLLGVCDPGLISHAKGAREYTLADFRLIADLLGRFECIVTTPNVMTEVSNLASRLREDIRNAVHGTLASQILAAIAERYMASAEACTNTVYGRLGLTDAVISSYAGRGLLVLTNDLDLAIALEFGGMDFIHYDRMLRPLTFGTSNS